jgi:hypothetical protein
VWGRAPFQTATPSPSPAKEGDIWSLFEAQPGATEAKADGEKEGEVPESIIKIGPNSAVETPQLQVDAQGNIRVPGLGGMTFAPNGDIYGSDGTKLYDGATGRWTAASGIADVTAEAVSPTPSGRSPKGSTSGDGASKTNPAPGAEKRQEAKPALPQVRIGDTLEQCIARLGEPKKHFQSFYFKAADWGVSVSFYRGRAVHVAYRKEIAKTAEFGPGEVVFEPATPETEIEALQQRNGGKREWQKTGAVLNEYRQVGGGTKLLVLFPDVKWRTKDGLLHFHYQVSVGPKAIDRLLTASTDGYKKREDGASDHTKMNRDDARIAWGLGLSIASIADADPKEAHDMLQAARSTFTRLRAAEAARAADPSLAIGDLPSKTANPQNDHLAIVKFLGQTGDSILKALGSDEVIAGEPAVAGGFELGRSAPAMLYVYHTGTPQLKADFLEHFAAAGRKSNLPKNLWEPLVEKAPAGVPTEDFLAAMRKMVADVTTFRGLWQEGLRYQPPPVPPGR